MTIRSLVITVVLLLTIRFAAAQEVVKEDLLNSFLEQLVSLGFEEYNISNISEEIAELIDNPVKINSKSRTEIERLFFLSPFQVQSIINYCQSNGDIISAYEISYIIGFDKELAKIIGDYITLDHKSNTDSYRYPRTQLLSSLIFSSKDTLEYPGSKIKTVSRFNHQSGIYNIRFSFEKDKGETIIYDKFKPEFVSGGLEISGRGALDKVIIGDFRARFGQGLSVWQGYAAGNSPLNPNPIKGASRIVAYSSCDENNYFRGIAASGNNGPLNILIYLSANRIDANTAIEADSGIVVKSLYDSGLHNSPVTGKKRNILGEYSAGLNVNLNFKSFNIGSSICWSHFNIPFNPNNDLENLYDFRGKNNIVFAVDHALSLNRLYLYGETAFSSQGGFASIQGIRLFPVERVKINFRWSYISRAFISFHGQADGSENLNSFRNNIMANITFEISPTLNFSAGLLKNKHLWFGYRSASFPHSIRYMGELSYKPMDICILKLSSWSREKNVDMVVETGIEQNKLLTNRSGRLHLELYPSTELRLNSRFEINTFPSGNEHGIMAFQGIRYRPADSPLSISLRFYAFSAPSYNTRIYAYEEDLLYSLAIPSFYGKGRRTYLLTDYRVSKRLRFRIKTGYSDFRRENIHYSYFEIKAQGKIRF